MDGEWRPRGRERGGRGELEGGEVEREEHEEAGHGASVEVLGSGSCDGGAAGLRWWSYRTMALPTLEKLALDVALDTAHTFQCL